MNVGSSWELIENYIVSFLDSYDIRNNYIIIDKNWGIIE